MAGTVTGSTVQGPVGPMKEQLAARIQELEIQLSNLKIKVKHSVIAPGSCRQITALCYREGKERRLSSYKAIEDEGVRSRAKVTC
jgi:P pilus assembly chaperone PapD